MSTYLVDGTDLTSVANAIREKGGTSVQLKFPNGFVNAVEAIEAGNGGGDDYFYIFHSKTTSVEAVAMSNGAFDFTSKVSGGCYYGGVFSAYGGVASEDLLTEAMATAKQYPGQCIPVSNVTPYDGSTILWVRANVYTETISPVAGTVYYLKEIPEAYDTITVFYTSSYNGVLVMAPVDDAVCLNAKCRIGTNPTLYTMRIAASYGGIRATDFDGVKGGYVAYKLFTGDELLALASECNNQDVVVTFILGIRDSTSVECGSVTVNFGDGSSDAETGFKIVSHIATRYA